MESKIFKKYPGTIKVVLLLLTVVFLYACNVVPPSELPDYYTIQPDGSTLVIPELNLVVFVPPGTVSEATSLEIDNMLADESLFNEKGLFIKILYPANIQLLQPVKIRISYDYANLKNYNIAQEESMRIFWLPDFDPQNLNNPENYVIREELKNCRVNSSEHYIEGSTHSFGAFMILAPNH